MQQETTDLIAQANEFIEENGELLDDPEVSIHVLQAILMQGAPIGTELAGEAQRLMDVAIPPANKLEDAINLKELPPKEIAVLAAEHKHTKGEYEAAYATHIRFSEFLKKAQDLYEREQEDEQAVAEEMNAEGAEKHPAYLDAGHMYIECTCVNGHTWPEARDMMMNPELGDSHCPTCNEKAHTLYLREKAVAEEMGVNRSCPNPEDLVRGDGFHFFTEDGEQHGIYEVSQGEYIPKQPWYRRLFSGR